MLDDRKHSPVLSRQQIAAGEGPEVYTPRERAELVEIYSEFIWHHTHLCQFHQMYYKQYVATKDDVEAVVAKHGSLLAETPTDDGHEYLQAKILDSIFDKGQELHSTRVFADNLLVIGLAATVEQFAGRTLVAAETILGKADKPPPHVFGELSKRFVAIGVDLSKCKSYADIDECRVLNNKIKHAGRVDKQLAALAAFAGHLDEPLDSLKFDLQRYCDGVFEFVGHVLEETDRNVPPGGRFR